MSLETLRDLVVVIYGIAAIIAMVVAVILLFVMFKRLMVITEAVQTGVLCLKAFVETVLEPIGSTAATITPIIQFLFRRKILWDNAVKLYGERITY